MKSAMIEIIAAKDFEFIAAKLDDLWPEAADEGVENVDTHLVDVFRTIPLRVTHDENNPYHWTNERQRQAYFASNGFGGGIPYQRTNEMIRNIGTVGYGRNQKIVAAEPYAKWVKVKETQQVGHKDDGWTTFEQDIESRRPWLGRWFNEGMRQAIERLGLA